MERKSKMGRKRIWRLTFVGLFMLLFVSCFAEEPVLFTGEHDLSARGEFFPVSSEPGPSADAAVSTADLDLQSRPSQPSPADRPVRPDDDSGAVRLERPASDHTGISRDGTVTQPPPGLSAADRTSQTPAPPDSAPTKAQPAPTDVDAAQPLPVLPPAKPGDSGQADTEDAGQEIKRIALTFDDGPDRKYTPAILDILKEKQVKATFFVVGIQVAKYEEELKRIVKEGHAVGNHTWDHADLTTRTPEEIADEIAKTDVAIREAIGDETRLLRPPYGAVDDKVKQAVASAGKELVLWNVDTRDWAGTEPDDMLENVKQHAKPNGIILMHCFGGRGGKLDNTVLALPRIIDALVEDGFSLVTIPELLDASNG